MRVEEGGLRGSSRDPPALDAPAARALDHTVLRVVEERSCGRSRKEW